MRNLLGLINKTTNAWNKKILGRTPFDRADDRLAAIRPNSPISVRAAKINKNGAPGCLLYYTQVSRLCAYSLMLGLTFLGYGIPANAQQARVLKLSHQYPAAKNNAGDYRDRLAHMFAQRVEKQTGGELKFQIYPGASLMNPKQQIDAMRNGTLDFSIVPLGYAGGKMPVANIGFLPAIIDSYEQGLRWKDAPIGKALERMLEKDGLRIVTWIWQAGSGVSVKKPVLVPADVRGLKVRGAGRPINALLQAAGAGITTFPSNESYNAMQSGVVDALFTSSASLLGFHLYEVSKYATSARDKTWVYLLQPLLMSEKTYESLTPKQQEIITSVGNSLQQFAMNACKADDQKVFDVFTKAGVHVSDMNEAEFGQWRALAKKSAWKNFAKRVKDGQKLLDMAQAVK